MTIAPTSRPDTLDLADRAGLALGGLLGTLDPEHDYDPYFLMFYLANPAYLLHWSGMYSGILPKFVEAIPLVRLMSGSKLGQGIEQGMFEVIFSNIAHDGLIYDEERPERPWNTGIGYGVKSWHEDYANLTGNGRLLL